jgi:uncharacterized membrane protein
VNGELPEGQILSVRRALTSLAVGAVVGGVVAGTGTPELAPMVGWIVATSIILVWIWRISWNQGPDGTKRLAEEEGQSRSTDTGVIIAAVASLGAVGWALFRASGKEDAVAVASVILAVVSVVLSWVLVNTIFTLKYARLYYLDADGGIDFKQLTPPSYFDFAYMAFTVGMAFAVAGSEPTDVRIRRVALGHALLSYALGTGVIAVAVNLVTSLGRP